MVLFDGGGDYVGYVDVVVVYDQVDWFVLFVQDVQFYCFVVFGVKLEDMIDFDVVFDYQGVFVVWVGVVFDDIVQVGDFGQWQVVFLVYVEVVFVFDVGVSGEIVYQGDGVVDDVGDWQVDWVQ